MSTLRRRTILAGALGAPFAALAAPAVHAQSGVDFFTTLADRSLTFFTADSDLGAFDSHTVGGRVTADIPGLFPGAHIDAGYERYWRTDGLTVNVALWQAGARF